MSTRLNSTVFSKVYVVVPERPASLSQKSITLPTCTSCNRPIMPREKASRFYCPNCHQVFVWRCERCRKFSRKYKCISCGFEGP